MGYMNQANDISQSKIVTNTFYGLDRNKKIADGYFADMTNMTCDDYPVIRSIKRTEQKRPPSNQGYINRKFLIDGVMTDCTFSVTKDGEMVALSYIDKNGNPQNRIASSFTFPFRNYGVDKTIVSIGSSIVVFPDGAICDVTKYPLESSNWEKLNASVSDKVIPFRGGQTVIAPCDRNGKPYEVNLGTSEEERSSASGHA